MRRNYGHPTGPLLYSIWIITRAGEKHKVRESRNYRHICDTYRRLIEIRRRKHNCEPMLGNTYGYKYPRTNITTADGGRVESIVLWRRKDPGAS